MSELILIIEDEEDVAELVVFNLKKAGYKTIVANDGAVGLTKIKDDLPALIILDLMLPSFDGKEICRRVKSDPKTAHIPILFLSAKSEEIDRIVGLELGADDYVAKPFSPRELILRVKMILRRVSESGIQSEIIKCGEVTIDTAKHQVTVNNRPVELTTTEFKLLSTLMERRNRVQSRDRLLSDVWGYKEDVDTRTVDTHMRRLREKLGTAADAVETIRGVGYRFTV